jgi:hypothetical protein
MSLIVDSRSRSSTCIAEIASVTVRSAVYIEYLHLVRTSEGWKIVTPSGSILSRARRLEVAGASDRAVDHMWTTRKSRASTFSATAAGTPQTRTRLACLDTQPDVLVKGSCVQIPPSRRRSEA